MGAPQLVSFPPAVVARGGDIFAKRWVLPSAPRSCRCSAGSSLSGAFESNILLSAAAKREPLDGVLQLFFNLRNRDTVSWNTAISSCLRHGHPRAALELFVEMLLAGKHPPDCITIRTVLTACGDMEALGLVSQIHAYVTKIGVFADEDLTMIYTCLVGLYWEQGQVELARLLFDRIPQKDVIAFTAMMTNCSRRGMYEETLRIYMEMIINDSAQIINGYAISSALQASARLFNKFLGKQIHAQAIKASLGSDLIVGTAVVDLYAKCGDAASAESAFSSISDPNSASWNAFIDGCSASSQETLIQFSRMRQTEVRPDHRTLAIVLRACRTSSLRTIQQLHGLIIKESMGIMDSFVGTALFQNYLATGCSHHARKVFDQIPQRDAVDFNLGISEYSQRGDLKEAIDFLFKSIEATGNLNGGAVNPLISSAKDLNMGKQLHGLATKFGLAAEINELLGCSLVSMYLKFGCPDDAINLFSTIDSPDLISWTSLLSGLSKNRKTRKGLNLYFKMVSEGSTHHVNDHIFLCILHACADLLAVEEGMQIHAHLVKSRPFTSDPCVLSSLLNMYAKCGYIAEAKKIFESIEEPDLALRLDSTRFHRRGVEVVS